MSDRKLDERELEALSHGRGDLVPEDAREAAKDDAFAAWIEGERESSREASVALKRAAPELPDLDAMIATAMAKAPEEERERAPSRRSLAIGAAIGALVAIGSGALSIAATDPRTFASGTLDQLGTGARLVVTLGTTLDRLASQVPGGWPALAVIGLAIVAALLVPLRVVAGPMRRAGTGLAAIALAWSVSIGAARAYDLEGEWPAEDARVTVDVDRAPRSVALQQACASAGIGLAYALDADPPVTLHVRDVPLREVLDAVLLDEPARVRRTGHMISLAEPAQRAAGAQASGVEAAEQALAPAPPPPIDRVPEPPQPAIPPPPAPPLPAVPPVPAAYLEPPPVSGELRDLVTFGGDARVLPQQQVRDVITMGGDATVEGQAFGNVVTMGGDADVAGTVVGDVVTMGGDIHVARSGRVHGQLNAMGGHISVDEPETRAQPVQAGIRIASGTVSAGELAQRHEERGWLSDALDALMKHALLFLLGLVLMGLAPARVGALQSQIVQQPLRALASGFLGTIAGAVLTLVLVITIVGIPGAIVLALGLFLAAYAGLASAAAVLGAALPVPALKDRPVLQLAAGIALLFVVSRVPVIGPLVGFLAMMVGLGAVLMTRAGQRPANGPANAIAP